MSVLGRLPPWATTGVGSLPYTDATIALARSILDYDLPFCPQLPRLDGDMIAEWLGGDPGRCGWSPERDRERPDAWDALLRALALAPPAHAVVKLQVTGPLRGRELSGERQRAAAAGRGAIVGSTRECGGVQRRPPTSVLARSCARPSRSPREDRTLSVR